MPAVIAIKRPEESLNQDQKTFRRLKTQLETLKEKERKQNTELDEGLLFYHEKIRIQEKNIDQALEERIYHAYQLYKTAKSFSKKEFITFKDLILSDIESLLKSVGIHDLPKKVEDIGKALGWKGAEATLTDELNPMIENIKNMFASQGINVDLSNINPKDSEEEMIRKLFEQVQTGMDQRETFSEKKPPKKSQKQQKIEDLQKKSINVIYKQLAKALHPDLELDPEKKAMKEEQMKRLTLAYETSDLATLLELERDWLDSSRTASTIKSPDQLKIYNKILRQQIGIIKDRIETLFLHPRYLPLQPFYQDRFTGMAPLFKAYRGTKAAVAHLESFTHKLKSPSAEKILKQFLQEERMRQEIEDDLFDHIFSTEIYS